MLCLFFYFQQFESENQLLDFLYFNRFVYLGVMCFNVFERNFLLSSLKSQIYNPN